MLKNTVSSSVQKARLLFETRKYEAVLSELAFYLENHQGDSDARFLLAESLWRVGRNAEALRQFDKCFNGDKRRRDIAVHVCSLLYHEISTANFYWSDLIYWCSSAIYCGVSVTFVKSLLVKFCGSQVRSIDNELFESHCKWRSDVKTLTEDVKQLRLSLKGLNKTPFETKSDNIHGVHSDLKEDHVPYYQETSQIDHNYFNGLNNYSLDQQSNTYCNTNILQPYSNNNNFNVNNSWHSLDNSEKYNIHEIPERTIVTLLHTHTKVKSTHNSVLGSKPLKIYQRQRRRKVYSRKLRKDLLLMILKYFRNTNLILLKCISDTHTRFLHYMSYLFGVKYLNYLPNSTRGCIIDENNNSERNTNDYYFNTTDSFDMPCSTQSNVQKAIEIFCPDNQVILERLRKKSKFDTKVATFNAIAKFCNNSNDILKCLQTRSTLNESHFSSPLEVPNSNREDTPHFVQFISDDSYSTNKLQVLSHNSLETKKRTLKMSECSFDAQQVSESQIIMTLSNGIVPGRIEDANKHELTLLNILVNKSHRDHEIINKVINEISTDDYIPENVCDYTDGHANNVIQHNNNIEIINMISCRDLEYKPTSFQLSNNKTHINCVKQKNFEVAGVSKKYYISRETCSHDAINKVSDTSIYLSQNNSKLNNCFVNISKHDQTAFANTLNNTRFNDCSNTIRNSVEDVCSNTTNSKTYKCTSSDNVEDSILYYSKMTTSKDFFAIEKYKGGNEVYNYCSKSKNKTKYFEKYSGIEYNSSKLDDLYKDNVCTILPKLADDGYVDTQYSNKYTDEVDHSNISSVKVFFERRNYTARKGVKDYASFFEKIFKIQQDTIYDKVDNTILSHNRRSDNMEDDFETNTNMDWVTVDTSVQCLTTLNLNDCCEAINSTECYEVGTIIACNSPSNTSVNNFRPLIRQVFEAVDKNVLEMNLDVLNKVKGAGLAAIVCKFINQNIPLYKIEANVQYDDQLGLNLSLLRKCKFQNVGFITELDNTHVKYSKKLDDIQNSISLCRNNKNQCYSPNFNLKTNIILRSNDYYLFENEQRLEKTILNTHNTQRKVPRLIENVHQRFFTPKYNSIEKSNSNIFHVLRSCHLVQLLKCCPSEHTSNLSHPQFFQDCSKNSKSYSLNDDLWHTVFNRIKMSEMCRSIATSDGGYDCEVFVGNKTIPNTQNFSFFMLNADEKYYSWSTNKKYFNSKVWSTHFDSIVKKYLHIPYYVDPKVDISIYLGNIVRSTTSSNSLNGNIMYDRCKCQIDHLIYNSFLHAALPNLRAISLFCDPSKLLVHNLCGDVFAKPVFNGVMIFSYSMPKSTKTVKDSIFLLVNLCTHICVSFDLS